MTTRVHVVNLGPQAVKVETQGRQEQTLYPGDSVNEYVYDTKDVKITEVPLGTDIR